MRSVSAPLWCRAALLAVALLAAVPALATEVKIVRATGAADFLQGKAEGVSIDQLGVLRLARRLELRSEIEEPFLLSAAVHPRGWVVGTGNSGRVFLVESESTEVRLLLDAEEEEIFAVLVAGDGSVYAGSSPAGKLYRVMPDGSSFVVFEPGERYIWALAEDAQGRILVGTGNNGKLLRVTPAATAEGEASVEELYDASDPHIRALLVAPGVGSSQALFVGTAGDGRILRIDEQGRAVSLYDADQPEITAFAAGPDGDLFAAAVASEASLVNLAPASAPPANKQQGDGENSQNPGSPSVQVSEASAASGSRPAGYQGPRSDVLRIRSNGSVESVGQLRRETVYSLLFEERLWIGTGQNGKLYSLRGEELQLEQDLDSRQLMGLFATPGGGISVAATDTAGIYSTSEEKRSEGTYLSRVLDAKYGARFGSLHWEGVVPPGTSLEFALRTGYSASPDDTWSDWAVVGGTGSTASPEASKTALLSGSAALDAAQPGRYAQWKVELRGGDSSAPGATAASPEVRAVEISYLQQNRRPEIEELEVLDPGEVLVAANFNPSNQVFEALTPNRDGVFTRIGDPKSDGRTKKLWKLGYRTLRWKASDPNGDELEYEVWVRAEDDEDWFLVADELEDDQLGFDATVLPDGRYRLRLRASDAPSNPGDGARVAERVTGSVVVDHTPPRLVGVRAVNGSASSGERTLELTVEDDYLPLRNLVYSVDAGEWRPVQAADGLVDSRREVVTVEVPRAAKLVLVRLVDGAFNQRTVDVLAEAPSPDGNGGSRGRAANVRRNQ